MNQSHLSSYDRIAMEVEHNTDLTNYNASNDVPMIPMDTTLDMTLQKASTMMLHEHPNTTHTDSCIGTTSGTTYVSGIVPVTTTTTPTACSVKATTAPVVVSPLDVYMSLIYQPITESETIITIGNYSICQIRIYTFPYQLPNNRQQQGQPTPVSSLSEVTNTLYDRRPLQAGVSNDDNNNYNNDDDDDTGRIDTKKEKKSTTTTTTTTSGTNGRPVRMTRLTNHGKNQNIIRSERLSQQKQPTIKQQQQQQRKKIVSLHHDSKKSMKKQTTTTTTTIKKNSSIIKNSNNNNNKITNRMNEIQQMGFDILGIQFLCNIKWISNELRHLFPLQIMNHHHHPYTTSMQLPSTTTTTTNTTTSISNNSITTNAITNSAKKSKIYQKNKSHLTKTGTTSSTYASNNKKDQKNNTNTTYKYKNQACISIMALHRRGIGKRFGLQYNDVFVDSPLTVAATTTTTVADIVNNMNRNQSKSKKLSDIAMFRKQKWSFMTNIQLYSKLIQLSKTGYTTFYVIRKVTNISNPPIHNIRQDKKNDNSHCYSTTGSTSTVSSRPKKIQRLGEPYVVSTPQREQIIHNLIIPKPITSSTLVKATTPATGATSTNTSSAITTPKDNIKCRTNQSILTDKSVTQKAPNSTNPPVVVDAISNGTSSMEVSQNDDIKYKTNPSIFPDKSVTHKALNNTNPSVVVPLLEERSTLPTNSPITSIAKTTTNCELTSTSTSSTLAVHDTNQQPSKTATLDTTKENIERTELQMSLVANIGTVQGSTVPKRKITTSYKEQVFANIQKLLVIPDRIQTMLVTPKKNIDAKINTINTPQNNIIQEQHISTNVNISSLCNNIYIDNESPPIIDNKNSSTIFNCAVVQGNDKDNTQQQPQQQISTADNAIKTCTNMIVQSPINNNEESNKSPGSVQIHPSTIPIDSVDSKPKTDIQNDPQERTEMNTRTGNRSFTKKRMMETSNATREILPDTVESQCMGTINNNAERHDVTNTSFGKYIPIAPRAMSLDDNQKSYSFVNAQRKIPKNNKRSNRNCIPTECTSNTTNLIGNKKKLRKNLNLPPKAILKQHLNLHYDVVLGRPGGNVIRACRKGDNYGNTMQPTTIFPSDNYDLAYYQSNATSISSPFVTTVFQKTLHDWWEKYELASHSEKIHVAKLCIQDMIARKCRFLQRMDDGTRHGYYLEIPPYTSESINKKVLRALRQVVLHRLDTLTAEERREHEQKVNHQRIWMKHRKRKEWNPNEELDQIFPPIDLILAPEVLNAMKASAEQSDSNR